MHSAAVLAGMVWPPLTECAIPGGRLRRWDPTKGCHNLVAPDRQRR